MEHWTAENFELVGLAMLKMAYNFWPIIALVVGYCIWETIYQPFERRARPKFKNATRVSEEDVYRADPRPARVRVKRSYSRDAAQHTGRRHL